MITLLSLSQSVESKGGHTAAVVLGEPRFLMKLLFGCNRLFEFLVCSSLFATFRILKMVLLILCFLFFTNGRSNHILDLNLNAYRTKIPPPLSTELLIVKLKSSS